MHTLFESQITGWAYESMVHNPNHAYVLLSYSVFHREILKQWTELREGGLEFIASSEDPYPDSAAMFEDVLLRNRLLVWTDNGKGLPDDHPMGREVESDVDGFKVLNDVFRGVHDVLGHVASGGKFGPKGEELAWRMHRSMLPPITEQALWCETIGQNKWTNFTHDHQSLQLRDRPFPDQKSGLISPAVLKP